MRSALIFGALTIAALVCVTVVSDGSDAGDCGDNVDYSISNRTLIISGTGAMYDYNQYVKAPWKNEVFYTVIIEDGVTHIGKNAFIDQWSVTSVTIADSVTDIGDGAFSGCNGIKTLVMPISCNATAFKDAAHIEDITLTKGDGTMFAYSDDGSSAAYYGNAPWNGSDLKYLKFGEGISSFDAVGFTGCTFKDSDEKTTITADATFSGHWFYKTSDALIKRLDGVTIRPVDSHGDLIGDIFNKNVAVGSDYSIEVPSITGYVASKSTVSGTLALQCEVINVSYSKQSYTLTINYKNLKGDAVADAHVESLDSGAEYHVNSPEITGYGANKPVVTGTMGLEDVTVDVTYTGKDCTLTVVINKYNMSKEEKTYTVRYMDDYHITVDPIKGFKGPEYLDGTMDQIDKKVWADFEPATFKMTIVHRDKVTKESIHEDYVMQLRFMDSADYDVPTIRGYTAPAGWVSVTGADEDTVKYLDYTPETFIITVRYVDERGTDVAIPSTTSVAYGKDYSVTSPTIKGLSPDKKVVSGKAYSNVSETVTYTKSDTGVLSSDLGGRDLGTLSPAIIAIVAMLAIMALAFHRKH